MYGTLLDQKVFEHLVQRCLPMLHEHFIETDVQLSVASLPWFMSLFISSMPLIFAFRIVDNFFMMGPKVLFQVALAILRINGEELLQVTDDGMFINVMKTYFASLGESAHPASSDPRLRQVTRFQVLLVTAFREFGIITDDTVASERKRFRAEVVESIETFIKRTAIRNLHSTGRLSKTDLSAAHDTFSLALYRSPRSRAVMYRDASGRPESRIDRAAFRVLLSEVASWAREERVVKNGFVERVEREVAAEHDFVERIFSLWDRECRGSLSFQDVVTGLDGVLYNDLMDNIAWFLNVHDKNKDGYLTKDEMLQLSESLLFIFRNEVGDHYLAAVSRLMQNAFEYAETIKEEASPRANGVNGAPALDDDEAKAERRRSGSIVENPHRPYISLATLRMVVLADEVLETFFLSDLTRSWRLTPQPDANDVAAAKPAGFFGGLAHTVNNLLTDEHKERLNRLADEVGKRLDIQSVEQRPAIGGGKVDPTSEPKTRESLFTPSPNPSLSSQNPSRSPLHSPSMARSPSGTSVDPLSAAAMRMPPPEMRASPTLPVTPSGLSYVPREQPARRQSAMSTALTTANQLPERPAFLLDRTANEEGFAIGDEEDDEDVDAGVSGAGQGDDTLDEVDAFLQANEG